MGPLWRSDDPQAGCPEPRERRPRAGRYRPGEAVGTVGDPIRVGVVGIGFGQAVHVPAFRRDPRCVVTAIAASTADRASAVADRLGVPHAYGDWRELVASDIDVVSIALPPVHQPAVVTAAAGAGKAVFCEKPVAADAAAAGQMLAAVESARIVSAVDYEFAELPAWREAKAAIDADAIGRPRSCEVTWHVRNRERPPTSWKERPEAGGGALGAFASHLVYLVDRCVGHIARAATARRDARALACSLETVAGCACTIDVVTDAETPTGMRARFDGDRGEIVVSGGLSDHARGYVLSIAGASTTACVRRWDDASAGPDARIDLVSPLVSRFLDAVAGGAHMTPDLSDGVRVQQVLEAIYTSRHGAWVPV